MTNMDIENDRRLAWFKDARFGMFIHWGLYAIPAGMWNGTCEPGCGEWIMQSRSIPVADYEQLVQQFNPSRFDARKWMEAARDAEMKYVVMTTKHHDGFCMFDSRLTDYTIMSTPFRRDVMAELASAAQATGIRICWYYSIMDWHHQFAQAPFHPNYDDHDRRNLRFLEYYNYLKGQVAELLSNYGPVGIMWFDGEWIADWDDELGRDLYAHCRGLQPDILVNNRVGKGRRGFEGTTEPGMFAGDYDTPEQQVPETAPAGAWESCITLNDTWGYRADDQNWKSAVDVVRVLQEINGKGGNLLLNVGPTAEGEIPPGSEACLREIGLRLRAG
jgi:alpha-L-fucosidase